MNKSERDRSSAEVADGLRAALADIAGCEITVSTSDMTALMGGGDDISVEITGTDYGTLSMIADDLAAQISGLADAVDVTTSMADQVPQVKVTRPCLGRRRLAARTCSLSFFSIIRSPALS